LTLDRSTDSVGPRQTAGFSASATICFAASTPDPVEPEADPFGAGAAADDPTGGGADDAGEPLPPLLLQAAKTHAAAARAAKPPTLHPLMPRLDNDVMTFLSLV